MIICSPGSYLSPPLPQVLSSIPQIASQLGLVQEAALHLVAKMPVLLALEPKLLALGINGEGGRGRQEGGRGGEGSALFVYIPESERRLKRQFVWECWPHF